MGIENRKFFIAAGRSLVQAEAWDASARECLNAARAWAKEIGAVGISFDGRDGLRAMKFDGPAPKGWVKHFKQREWSVPSYARSAVAKAVRARAKTMRPAPAPGGEHFGPGDDGRMYLFYSSIRSHEGKWIIGQHKDVKEPPPDAIPMKLSEYVAMMEAAEEKEEAEPARV